MKIGLKRKIQRFDRKFGLASFESWLSSNKFNVLLTLYVCVRSFPLRQAIRLPFFVYGWPRIYGLSGSMKIEGKTRMGMVRFNRTMDGAPSACSTKSELKNDGLVIFRGSSFIGTGNKIRVGVDAVLDVGNNTKISDFCNIGCYSTIKLGDTTRIAHRCQLFDSNYHYIANFTKRFVAPRTKPIIIGDNCWICNTTTVTGGATIPDYVIVASNSLVGKNYSSLEKGSLIGGMPAKLIAEGLYRIERKGKLSLLETYFDEHGTNDKYIIPECDNIEDYL